MPSGNLTSLPNIPKVIETPAYNRMKIEEDTNMQIILRKISVLRFSFLFSVITAVVNSR